MQIQFRSNVEAPRTGYQTQNLKAAPPSAKAAPVQPALGADQFQSTRPNLVVVQPAQTQAAPAANPWGGVLSAIGNMVWNGLTTLMPAVAMVKGIADVIGAAAQQLLSQPQSQPEAQTQAHPQAQPVKPAVSPLAQACYEAAFQALDLDGNGKLEGQELTDNAMFTFQPNEAGLRAEQFVSQAADQEEAELDRRSDAAFEARDLNGDGVLTYRELAGTDSPYSPGFDPANEGIVSRERFRSQVKATAPGLITGEAARESSTEARMRRMFQEVFGPSTTWTDGSSKWWKGQLKGVGGDWNALKAKMVEYRDETEAIKKQYQRDR